MNSGLQQFPYLNLLKQAYSYTTKHLWLWVFGLFIGGTFTINLSLLNFIPETPREQFLLTYADNYDKVWQFIALRPQLTIGILVASTLIVIALLILNGVSKAGLICSCINLMRNKPITLRKAIAKSWPYVGQVIGLQILLTGIFVLSLAVVSAPTIYLLSIGALGRGLVLGAFALIIIIPALLILGFVHLFGPIIIVFYNQRIMGALRLSFSLVRRRLKESIILASFLMGLGIIFSLFVLFSLTLIGLPVGILALATYYLHLPFATTALIISLVIASIVYVTVIGAGFKVFQNIVWILAIQNFFLLSPTEKTVQEIAVEPVT